MSEDSENGPYRYNEAHNFIPITFNDSEGIIKYGRKIRTWYWELSLYDNKYRYDSLIPKVKFENVDDYEKQWDKVLMHPLIMEIDASRKGSGSGGRNEGRDEKRRDILEKEIYLEAMNEFINIVNKYCIEKLRLGSFEWLFSGNGLYWVGNGYLNSVVVKEKLIEKGRFEGDNNQFFNKQLFTWDKKLIEIIELTKDVSYLKVDDHLQYLREYIKTPFSLHQNNDVICLPLTALFGGNDKIDMKSSLFLKMIEPKNLTKVMIEKYFRKWSDGHVVNNFLNF